MGKNDKSDGTKGEDRSHIVKIKLLDGKRMVEFVAVPAKHERILEYVRSDERGTIRATLQKQGSRH